VSNRDRAHLHDIAKALGGEVCGRSVRAPGPKSSPKGRSLEVRIEPRAPGGLFVMDWRDGEHLVAKDHVMRLLGRQDEWRKQKEEDRVTAPPQRAADKAHEPEPEPVNRRLALAIWKESQHPRGTPVEAYLTRERGLPLPVDAVPRALRFHPACPFGGGIRRPAMVALVRNIRTNEPQAIHRTVLDWEGRKAVVNGRDRWTLAPTSGGAVKLTADAEITTCLGIGEGIESTLSLRRMPEADPALPLWSLLSTSGMRAIEPLAGIESLWVAVDHDPSGGGERAARVCATNWHAAGAEVLLFKPTRSESDLNDFFKTRNETDAARG
jgi:putative DNA primase/helicase